MKKFILTLLATVFSFYVVSAQTHFTPVWDGNGYDHMNIYIFGATLDNMDLQPGDEIGVFDGDYCVGVGEVATVITVDDPLEIRVSKDDPTTTDSIDGFIDGNNIIFIIWDDSEGVEHMDTDPLYTTGIGKFIGSGSASLTLGAKSPNNAPEFTSTPNTTATEDVEYVYDIIADDPDLNAQLIIKAPVKPPWLTFVDNKDGTAVLKGTPSNRAVDSLNKVILTLTDGIIDTLVIQEFNITVTNVNDAPEIVSQPVTAAQPGVVYTYTVKVEDIDGDAITITQSGMPAWMTFTDNGDGTAVLTGTPAVADDGTSDIIITASDGTESVTQSFTVKVSSTNTAPVFKSEPVESALENILYKYNVTGYDPDEGTNLIFSATTIPEWLELTDNGDGSAILEGVPLHEHIGDHNVELSLTDGIETITQPFTITVSATSNAPVIETKELDTAKQDVAYTMTIDLSDVDSDELYVKLLKSPPWLTIQSGITNDSTVVTLSGGVGSFVIGGTPTIVDVKTTSVAVGVSDGEFNRSTIYKLVVEDVNDPPVALNIEDTLREDKLKYIALRGQDRESGNNVSYEIDVDPVNGTLEPVSVNLYIYRPDQNYFGSDSFKYVVIDEEGLTDTALVKLEITPINDPPTLQISNRELEMFENDTLSFTVTLSDAIDLDSAANLKVIKGFGPFNGKLLFVDDDPTTGFLEYVPNEDFVGTDVLFLQAQELHADSLKSKQLMITVKVKNVNSPPVAFDRTIHLREDRPRVFKIFAYDREDDIIELVADTLAGNAPMYADSIKFDGLKVYYKPIKNNTLDDQFKVVITDTEGGKDTATIDIIIHPVNDRPIALNDTIDATGVTNLNIDFTDLVSDAETHDTLLDLIVISNKGILGGVIIPGSHNLEINWDVGTNIYDTEYIVYRVSDSVFRSRPGVIVIENILGGTPLPGGKSLKAADDPPNAVDDSAEVNLGEEVEVVITGLDVDHPFDSVSFDIIQQPQYGNFTFTKGLKAIHEPGSPVSETSVIYAPTTSDQQVIVDKIKFKATDAEGDTAVGEITFTAYLVADDPDIVDVSDQEINEDESLAITITYEDLDQVGAIDDWSLSSTPTLEGLTSDFTDTTETTVNLTVTPPQDFAGNITLVVTCVDDSSLADSVEFNLSALDVNDAPVLQDIDEQNTIQATAISLLVYAEDIDSDSLTYTAESTTEGAIDTITVDGSEITITPENGFTGTAVIEVTVDDNELSPLTNMKSFNLNVIADDDAPVFSTTLLHEEIDEDNQFVLQVTPIDSKPDDLLTVTVLSSNQDIIPADSVSIDTAAAYSNVIRTIEFNPVAEGSGESKITIYIDDEEGNQAIQQFNLTVNAVDDAPVLDAVDDISMNEDYTKAVSLSATDNDSYDLTFSAFSDNEDLTVSVESNLLTINALNDYYGTESIKVYVTDDNSTDSVTVVVTVDNVQDEPKFVTRKLSAATQDIAYSATIEASDPDPDVLSFGATGLPAWLTLTGNTLSGTPANDDVGQVSIEVSLTDNVMADSIYYSYNIVVVNVNDAPTFTSTEVTSATAGTAYSYNITGSDIDVGDEMEITATTTLPGWLTLTDNGDGTATLQGTPTNDDKGDVVITLRVSDGEEYTEQTFTLNVKGTDAIDEEFVNSIIQVYPNPSSGIFEVTVGELINGEIAINVYNIDGKLVYTGQLEKISKSIVTEVDLSGYPTGYYSIEISSDELTVDKRILIK